MSAVAQASAGSVTSSTPVAQNQGAGSLIEGAREAQRLWAQTALSSRIRILGALRNQIAEHAAELADLMPPFLARTKADTLMAEILPLADAIRFLERKAPGLLKSKPLGIGGRPLWLWQVSMQSEYVPHGIVLVIGPGNYPLFLPGVQALQALVAGNAVLLKPGVGGFQVAQFLALLAAKAGLPEDLLTVLEEDAQAAQIAISDGVDKIVMTGSSASGRAVLKQAADHLTPAVLELSGCDAVFVLPNANVIKAVEAVVFGLLLNGGATCISPRRVFVHSTVAAAFQTALSQRLRQVRPVKLSTSTAALVYELIQEAIDTGAALLEGCGLPAGAAMRPRYSQELTRT